MKTTHRRKIPLDTDHFPPTTYCVAPRSDSRSRILPAYVRATAPLASPLAPSRHAARFRCHNTPHSSPTCRPPCRGYRRKTQHPDSRAKRRNARAWLPAHRPAHKGYPPPANSIRATRHASATPCRVARRRAPANYCPVPPPAEAQQRADRAESRTNRPGRRADTVAGQRPPRANWCGGSSAHPDATRPATLACFAAVRIVWVRS